MRISSWIAMGSTALVWATPTIAEIGDTSADAASFHSVVRASEGVMIGVPINERGEENTSAAQIRVFDGPVPAVSELPRAWARAVDGTRQPVHDSNADSSTDGDSSTSGWGWNRWGGYGWRYNYYNYYQPRYYYYGNYYNYGQPYYYTNYYNYDTSPYYGYRWYYYGRIW
jgi:hypothetical protein